MIGRLRGAIEQVDEDSCVVDVNGVGYVVHASSRTLRAPCASCSPASRRGC
jgi:holliday junction DNA helicase RuvA